MRLPRHVSLVDLSVAALAVIAVAMPARTTAAVPAYEADAALALARAEARTFVHADDGQAAADLTRALVTSRQYDWAVDRAHALAAAQQGAPQRWRTLLAASVAHAERLEAAEALTWAERSLDACAGARASCPSWEEVRVQLYADHLDAGVRSGIDPKVDPAGFRRAAEAGAGAVRLTGGPQRGAPTPAAGSGDGASTP
ncbi:MAG: hypothetical protein R2939_08740 [Kofleriaceae bacterium]